MVAMDFKSISCTQKAVFRNDIKSYNVNVGLRVERFGQIKVN